MARASRVVLYVEDEETDRFLMQRAFANVGLQPELRLVNDGRAALDYLSKAGASADGQEHPSPGVVLLDLNLPEINGFEVLKWIRLHPVHRDLPVVVFSSSARDEDRVQAHQLGANEFIPKPNAMALLAELARKLHEQWLRGTPEGLMPQ